MYEYVDGKAMWANISTPNTKFEPHKYGIVVLTDEDTCLLYTSPSPRDVEESRMPSSA